MTNRPPARFALLASAWVALVALVFVFGAPVAMVAAGDSMADAPFVVLSASDPAADDFFGAAVDISGDTLIVGANGQDDLGFSAGAAFIFQREFGCLPDLWREVAMLTASDGQPIDWFGVDVAISGDTVVIGAQLADAPADASGAAYIFERTEDGWQEITKLVASDGEHNDDFGIGVEIDGDTVVVGALLKNTEDGRDAGAAYVFERNLGGPDNWGEVARLVASDGAYNDRFGRSLDISGDTIVVGSSLADSPGANAGALYVYERDAGGYDAWGEVAKLVASNAQPGDNMGFGVAIDGNTLVAGAYLAGSGKAYVFQRDSVAADVWVEVSELSGPETTEVAQFGRVVDVRDGVIVVGAPNEDVLIGAAYLFEQNLTGDWSPAGRLALSGPVFPDQLGWGVAIDQGIAVVGVPNADIAAPETGAVLVTTTGGDCFGPSGVGSKGLLELEPEGQLVQWPFPEKQASEIFTALTIAWLFDSDSSSWTSFIPQLAITDFLVTEGDVLWLVSPNGEDIVVPLGLPTT